METKLCKICNVTKDTCNYIKCPSSSDGFQNRCKDCVKKEREIWSKLRVNCEFCELTMVINKLRKHVKDLHWAELINKNPS